jgi:TetR/AcrR family fatty acid metabolism transcriptional regulator
MIAGKETAAEKLLMMIEAHFKYLYDDHHLAIVTQLELRQSNKELRLRINNVLKGYLRVIDKIIIEGIETGEFSKQLDVRLARQMIFGTMDETATTWVLNEEKYDLVALAKPVHQLLIKGCGNH